MQEQQEIGINIPILVFFAMPKTYRYRVLGVSIKKEDDPCGPGLLRVIMTLFKMLYPL